MQHFEASFRGLDETFDISKLAQEKCEYFQDCGRPLAPVTARMRDVDKEDRTSFQTPEARTPPGLEMYGIDVCRGRTVAYPCLYSASACAFFPSHLFILAFYGSLVHYRCKYTSGKM